MEQVGYEESLKEIIPYLDVLTDDSGEIIYEVFSWCEEFRNEMIIYHVAIDLLVRLAFVDQLTVIFKFFLDVSCGCGEEQRGQEKWMN